MYCILNSKHFPLSIAGTSIATLVETRRGRKIFNFPSLFETRLVAEKNVRGHGFGEKIPLPGGLTGPASDAGASVATGMSRNARRTVTPRGVARRGMARAITIGQDDEKKR